MRFQRIKHGAVNKTKLELGLLLPEVDGSDDQCVARLSSTLEGAHGIGNSYKSIATPTVIIETESGRKYAVSVMNVTGPGHPQGSIVIAFSEIGEEGIVSWGPFFVEDLPPN